jgi:hypothetical protein
MWTSATVQFANPFMANTSEAETSRTAPTQIETFDIYYHELITQR